MNKLKLIAFWMAMLSFSSCSESLCDDPFRDTDGTEQTLEQGISLRYEISPGNWQSMIGINGIYTWDTVRIYDENRDLYDRYDPNSNHFYLTYADKHTPRGIDIIQTYYLYLTYHDTDTMRFEFKINDSKCKKTLAYGRFFYNNQLIESSENENFIPVASFEKK